MVIDSRGLAPQGWHVPTKSDWDILGNKAESKAQGFDGLKIGSGGYRPNGSGFIK